MMLPSTLPRIPLQRFRRLIVRKWAKMPGFHKHYAEHLSSLFDDYIAAHPITDEPKPEPKPLSWYASKRKAAKLLRTPVWADQEAIMEVYRQCYRLTHRTGIEHHVDHILPLQGRKVSGLHVAANLRVITATENVRKGNTYEVDE